MPLGFRVYHVFIPTKTQPFILLHDVLAMSKPMATQMVLFFWLRITIQAQQEEEKQIGYRPGKT
jgi:hypothetical protein